MPINPGVKVHAQEECRLLMPNLTSSLVVRTCSWKVREMDLSPLRMRMAENPGLTRNWSKSVIAAADGVTCLGFRGRGSSAIPPLSDTSKRGAI